MVKTRRQLSEHRNKLLRKKQAKIKNTQPERDRRYLQFIRDMDCAVCVWLSLEPSFVPQLLGGGWMIGQKTLTQACHMGPHALGQKASDYTCVPLCASHHEKIGSSIRKLEALGINYAELTRRLREAYRERQKDA